MLNFRKLWDSHPYQTSVNDPCSSNGKPNYSDQCAIRIGATLAKCGVKSNALSGTRHCWFHSSSEGHILSAEELAGALERTRLPGSQNIRKIHPDLFKKELIGKTGIIFFKDYWQRTSGNSKESFRNRSGDHIDLWNGYRLAHMRSIVQLYLRIGSIGLGSDHSQSKEIWFWEVP